MERQRRNWLQSIYATTRIVTISAGFSGSIEQTPPPLQRAQGSSQRKGGIRGYSSILIQRETCAFSAVPCGFFSQPSL